MLTLFIAIVLPVMCAVSGYVVANILTSDGMLLNRLRYYVESVWKVPDWIHKPLLTCRYCIAGQLSLWSTLYLTWSDYDLMLHVWACVATLFVSDLMTYVEVWVQRWINDKNT